MPPVDRPLARKSGPRNQGTGEDAARDQRPLFPPVQRRVAEDGRDPEAERRARRNREAGAEQPVEPSPLHREPNPGEHRDQRCRKRDHRVEHEPHLRQLERRS